ncbi:MAG TPA: rhodanese-like domain-containing protein [Burkholderiales bacterium]|nr:rhodanese-like domain-containing protein [Burkholderiales bacterium]
MRWLLIAISLLAFSAHGDEFADYGVAPQETLRQQDFHAPTPLAVPGARTITTAELRKRLQAPPAERPLLIDVLGGYGHASLPGAVWLPGAGRGGSFEDPIQARLGQALRVLSGGNAGREMVFFCASPQCWLSYNAALRAIHLRYSTVAWYRGGIEAWGESGGALEAPRVLWRPDR